MGPSHGGGAAAFRASGRNFDLVNVIIYGGEYVAARCHGIYRGMGGGGVNNNNN